MAILPGGERFSTPRYLPLLPVVYRGAGTYLVHGTGGAEPRRGSCESPRKPEAARFTVSSGRESSDLIAPASAYSASVRDRAASSTPGPRQVITVELPTPGRTLHPIGFRRFVEGLPSRRFRCRGRRRCRRAGQGSQSCSRWLRSVAPAAPRPRARPQARPGSNLALLAL